MKATLLTDITKLSFCYVLHIVQDVALPTIIHTMIAKTNESDPIDNHNKSFKLWEFITRIISAVEWSNEQIKLSISFLTHILYNPIYSVIIL